MSGFIDGVRNVGRIGIERAAAVRRRTLKRWLRAHGVSYRVRDMYRESALRKLVRKHSQIKEPQAAGARDARGQSNRRRIPTTR